MAPVELVLQQSCKRLQQRLLRGLRLHDAGVQGCGDAGQAQFAQRAFDLSEGHAQYLQGKTMREEYSAFLYARTPGFHLTEVKTARPRNLHHQENAQSPRRLGR